MADSDTETSDTPAVPGKSLGIGGIILKGLGISGEFIFKGILGNIVGFLIPSLFTVIFAVLKFIGLILYYIFVKIVPFMVVYFGIPLFILGAMMALLFVGGHMFFLVAFFVGVFFYIKGVFNIKLKPPELSAEVEATL